VLHLIGDAILKAARAEASVGRTCRINEYARFCYGFEMVLLIASWGHFRCRSPSPSLTRSARGSRTSCSGGCSESSSRQRGRTPSSSKRMPDLPPPRPSACCNDWAMGMCFAAARTRKFTDGKHLRDLVQHLPRTKYHRIKTSKPDGRRRDYWVYECRRSLKDIGDVTIILSKQRRNTGPKKTKIIVTNLEGASAGQVLSYYARRWGIEVTIKETQEWLASGTDAGDEGVRRVFRGRWRCRCWRT